MLVAMNIEVHDDVEPPGRESELEILRGFARRVRAGSGGGLVLVGEYGVGKSTLARAVIPVPGLRILRCRARPDEPASGLAVRLFGKPLAAPGLVAIANTALEAIAAETRGGPVLWLVDDLELADRSARTFLGYVARRIAHLPAGIVLSGWRRGEPMPASVATVRLHPLPAPAIAEIVRNRLGPLAPDWVVDELTASAGGNPLAAQEFSAVLSRDEVAGRSGLPIPPRPGPEWSERWRWTAAGLSDETRTAMLTVAAGDGLQAGVLDRACVLLGLGPNSLAPLEARRLVRVDDGGRAWARRPHRSAVYHVAAVADRDAVHVALAEALAESSSADEPARARHLAAAATAPDEKSGDQLEAALRGVVGSPVVVDGWIRAAELTEDGAVRSRRLVSAGLAAWQTGRPAQAAELVERAERRADDPEVAGTAALVRGAVALSHGMPADALRVLAEGARAAADLEPDLAVDLAARMAGMAWWAGRADWAGRAVELADIVQADSRYSAFVRAVAPAGLAVLRSEFATAVGSLTRALRDAENLTEPRQLLFTSEVAGMAGDDLAARRFCDRAIQVMRGRGRTTELPFALQLRALILAAQGRAEVARACAREGLLLAARAGEESGGVFQHVMLAHVDALDGDVEACAEHRDSIARLGGEQPAASLTWALGRLAVSQARFADGVDIMAPAVLRPDRHPTVSLFATPDLVEAAVAVGRTEPALEALGRFGRWRAAGSSWAAAVEPRLRALVAPPDEAEERFAAACRAPGLAYRPLESARTRLAYGTFLRSQRRRSEAREQLHVALGLFESLQLSAWVESTRSALRASGEAGAAPRVEGEALTPQELEIARMAMGGRSNREVADTLHLSSRTIEYHLSKIYVKLGLSSRGQLAQALAEHG
jgi:DNA-binding CsgD family transcriptional regulator